MSTDDGDLEWTALMRALKEVWRGPIIPCDSPNGPAYLTAYMQYSWVWARRT